MDIVAFLFLPALLLAAMAPTMMAQKVTYVINTESCEEGMLNSGFTRVGTGTGCTLMPGLQHGTVQCTGERGEAVGQLWGILK